MPETQPQRLIALVLYPGCLPFDVAAPLHHLSRSNPGFRVTTVAARMRPVWANGSLKLLAEHTFEEVPTPAVILIPGGGASTVAALADRELVSYLRKATAHAELVTAVGTGSLLLAAAGALQDLSATTPFFFADMLRDLGAHYVPRDLVEDGRALTAADSFAVTKLVVAVASRLSGFTTSPLAPQGDTP